MTEGIGEVCGTAYVSCLVVRGRVQESPSRKPELDQLMTVAWSSGGDIPVLEAVSLSYQNLNEESSAVNSVRSFVGHSDSAQCAFVVDKILPDYFEDVQQFKCFQNPERARPWYGASVRTGEFLCENNVAS